MKRRDLIAVALGTCLGVGASIVGWIISERTIKQPFLVLTSELMPPPLPSKSPPGMAIFSDRMLVKQKSENDPSGYYCYDGGCYVAVELQKCGVKHLLVEGSTPALDAFDTHQVSFPLAELGKGRFDCVAQLVKPPYVSISIVDR